MTAERIDAHEAEKLGMVFRVIQHDRLQDEALALAHSLAEMPTKAFGLIKKALDASYSNDLEAQLLVEDRLQFEASQTEDYQEGVAAFLEKRKPAFRGR